MPPAVKASLTISMQIAWHFFPERVCAHVGVIADFQSLHARTTATGYKI